MAGPRQILDRRASIAKTRKITRTMELVSAAKLKKAEAEADAFQPYARVLQDIVTHLQWAATGANPEHALMHTRNVQRVALVVCASERGLCGSYNVNIVRAAIERKRYHEAQGRSVDFSCFGRKGAGSLRFLGEEIAAEYAGFIEQPDFDRTRDITNLLMERYVAEDVDLVEVVHARFINLATLRPRHFQLLPCGADLGRPAPPRQLLPSEYFFHPEPRELLSKLVPRTVRVEFYSGLLQAAAGEQAARRLAMKTATESADEIIGELTRQYNGVRQSKITQEIAEIVGAVEAMS
ncbi:MAG: ATP synthase F1 subunit gamma [Planctomycetota bacterium]